MLDDAEESGSFGPNSGNNSEDRARETEVVLKEKPLKKEARLEMKGQSQSWSKYLLAKGGWVRSLLPWLFTSKQGCEVCTLHLLSHGEQAPLVARLKLHPLSPRTFSLPQWRQQGGFAMVCFTFCTWTWQTPATGLAPDPSRAPGFRDIGWCFPGDSVSWERASSLLPLLWPKRARSCPKLILGTQGVTALHMQLGHLDFPVDKAICPRTPGFCCPLIHLHFYFIIFRVEEQMRSQGTHQTNLLCPCLPCFFP